MARNPSKPQNSRTRPRRTTLDNDNDSHSESPPPVKPFPKTYNKPLGRNQIKAKSVTRRKEESDEDDYSPEKRKGAVRGKKEVVVTIREAQQRGERAGNKVKNGLKGDVSVDSIASGQEDGEDDEGEEERSGTEHEEGESENEVNQKEEVKRKKGVVIPVKGVRTGMGRKGKKAEEGKEDFMVDGKKLSVEQLRAMMASLSKEGAMKVLCKVGSGMLEVDEMEEEGIEDIEFEEEADKGQEYEEIAMDIEERLQDQFSAVAKGDTDVITTEGGEGISLKAAACLESRLGSDILAKYHDWVEAERTFKAASRGQWDEMMKSMDTIREKMLAAVGQIEKIAASRTQIILAARKAYDEKVVEHEEEAQALKTELDRLQKKAVKAYDKYTDEEAITRAINLRLDLEVHALKQQNLNNVKRKKSKSKVQESEDETDGIKEEIEEEDEEEDD